MEIETGIGTGTEIRIGPRREKWEEKQEGIKGKIGVKTDSGTGRNTVQ